MIPLPVEAVSQLINNHAYLDEKRPFKSVYQTFRIICPKCGSTVTVTNFNPSDGTFSMDTFGYLQFNCKYCMSKNIEVPVQLFPKESTNE